MSDPGPWQDYARMLKELAGWFQSLQARCGGQMQCANGCARCCHGLFDVSLPDALSIALGFRALAPDRQAATADAAAILHGRILQECPELKEPYFLCGIPEEKIDGLADRIGSVRCPLLDEKDGCLIYAHRPLACRLEGVPMVDRADGLFGDWCESNFKEGIGPELMSALQLDYYRIQAVESAATAELSVAFSKMRREGMTVFIPSVLAASRVYLAALESCGF